MEGQGVKRRSIPLRKRAEAPGVRIRRAMYFVLILIAAMSALVAVPLALYDLGWLGYNSFVFVSDAAVSLSFLASTLLYLRFVDRSRKGIAERLGLGRDGLSLRNVLLGLMIFSIILTLELITGLVSQVTGVQISTNVDVLLASAPLWFYAFSCIVAPLCEEVLFRGLMVPRLGIVVSALVFAALHASYDSTFAIEVIAALIFALIAGYVFRKTKSLYPSLVAHILVNTLTIVVTFIPGI